MNQKIETDSISLKYRKKAVDLENKKILMTKLTGTEQEKDLKEPPNCDGFGRIRHFELSTSATWPQNPLPIGPAQKALGLPQIKTIRAQVFQNAVCNWRCWYCYVPFALLSGDPSHSSWMSVSNLLDLYLSQNDPPPVIDLSGGQPDLIPEWVPWTISELKTRGLENKVYLWSDDNLSNDYFWKFLNKDEIELIRTYRNYGKVCCFKGFDEESFSFNTIAKPELFSRQFELIERFLKLGIDLYAYVTLTTPNNNSIVEKINNFIDKLKKVDFYLPLRTIPLEIKMYNSMSSRVNNETNSAMKNQQTAIDAWQTEIKSRYSKEDLSLPINEIPIGEVQKVP